MGKQERRARLSAYEDDLARFAVDWPAYFWQFNFWSAVGTAAVGLEVIRLVYPALFHWSPGARLAVFALAGLLSAQVFQGKYRRRAARLSVEPGHRVPPPTRLPSNDR